MALTYKYDILMESRRYGEFVCTSFDKSFTSWKACQTESLAQLMNWTFPDHFGHPYIRYTYFLGGKKIKSELFCPANCGIKHHG